MTSTRKHTAAKIIISTHILTRRMTNRPLCCCRCLFISTHILTRRMTSTSFILSISQIFQLTSSRGGWQFMAVLGDQKSGFQLTSSRGGWRPDNFQELVRNHFNSHPHEEDDKPVRIQLSWHIISTHILTRRMTWLCDVCSVDCCISTHILTRRMTRAASEFMSNFTFQLTSSRGGWPKLTTIVMMKLKFQLTSSRGGWQIMYRGNDERRIFQLTSSRGGWRCTDVIVPH